MDNHTQTPPQHTKVKSQKSNEVWLRLWPLTIVLGFTVWLWQPVLALFWYRDDYPLLYWLMHPEGPVNPADVGDFKLPIYHGLLELHWPFWQLFGTDPGLHRVGQLGLLLVAVGLVYWLTLRLSKSHLIASVTSLLLSTTPVALTVAERISLAYQGYLVIALLVGVLLCLVQWSNWPPRSLAPRRNPETSSEHLRGVPDRGAHRRRWIIAASALFLTALFFVGVRLHAAFLGISAFTLWLSWSERALRREAWAFVGVTAIATVGMVLLGGLGRNELVIAPTVFLDILGSVGNLFLPSIGTDALLAPVENDPIAILTRYRWLVGLATATGLVALATLTTPKGPLWGWKQRSTQIFLGLSLLLGTAFLLATPDVSQGDRTLNAEVWLSYLAGGHVLLVFASLLVTTTWPPPPRMSSAAAKHLRGDPGQANQWQQQLMIIGLGWAILGFLPAFLVQPGAPFGTTDKYFVSSLPGLILVWIGALSVWRKLWRPFGTIVVIGLILWGAWLIRSDLATQQVTRAIPARTIHRQLADFSQAWPQETRIVILPDTTPGAAYQLHEAFAASTIRDEAIFTVLYGTPYDTRKLRLTTLDEVAAELAAGTIESNQLFVYVYSVPPKLVDRSATARALLIGPTLESDQLRAQLLSN